MERKSRGHFARAATAIAVFLLIACGPATPTPLPPTDTLVPTAATPAATDTAAIPTEPAPTAVPTEPSVAEIEVSGPQTLVGHSGAVTSLAFSPGGAVLASTGHDNTVYLWDIATGQVVQTLQGGSASVKGVDFGPDGNLLATIEADQTIALWDLAAGQILRRIGDAGMQACGLEFSPDGTLLASGHADMLVRLWDTQSGELLRALSGMEGVSCPVAFSPDGTLVASGGGNTDSRVLVWEVASGRLRHTLSGHDPNVYRVVFSPDGTLLASASGDRTAKIWDVASGRLLHSLDADQYKLMYVDFSPDGRLLVSGGDDGLVRLWDVASGQLLNTLRGHSREVYAVAFSPVDPLFASAGEGGDVLLWQISPTPRSGEGVIAYCYQPMTGGSLHQIYVINADGSGNRKLVEATIGLNHHDWSPDAQKIAAVGYVDGSTWSIHVFAVAGGDLTRLTHIAGVWDSEPAWSPDGSQIAFIRIYPDQDFREEIWLMNADGSDAHWIGVEGFAAKWSPDGSRFIYTSDRSGNYEVYTCDIDGTDEQQWTQTSADESFPIWSPDESQIAYSASTGEWNTPENTNTHEIYVMDADGSHMRQLTDNTAYDSYPRWSPDGSLIVFSSDRDRTGHWEVYVMHADGSDVRRVTHTPSDATAINPVWRPSVPLSDADTAGECGTSRDPLLTQLVYDVEISHDAGFWSFSTPEEEGMDADLLEAGVAALAEFSNMYSVLILRNDKIVLEQYFQDEEPRHARDIQSASKSFLSALVGIAIHEGYIQSVDQAVAEFLPTYFSAAQDPRKLDITLRHLLTMTPGFSYQDNLYDLTGDWLATAISYPLVSEPGSEFNYSTISSHILSAVLTEATEMSTCEFAYQYLFQPMGITIDNWSRDPQGYYMGGVAMYFTPRELARFGLLYLHDGIWDGHQLIPAEWIAESTSRHVNETGFPGVSYGYYWWRESAAGYEVYAAVGHGGQTIRIVPDLNLVVVTTADSYAPTQGIEVFPLLEEYVIPSIQEENS